METNDVFVFQVITPYVPLEIIGTINGHPFYYRGRHDRWAVYDNILTYGNHGTAIKNGDTSHGRENELSFAIVRILSAFEETLRDREVIVG